MDDQNYGLQSKNIYLKKDGKIVGLHAVGYAGPYEYRLIKLDKTEELRTTDFMPMDMWGNEYNENYEMQGRGSFRIFAIDLDDEAKDWEADGWVRFEREGQ